MEFGLVAGVVRLLDIRSFCFCLPDNAVDILFGEMLRIVPEKRNVGGSSKIGLVADRYQLSAT